MPTYEYKCKECHNKFEVKQSMQDPEITNCPKCNGKVSKIMNIGGIAFKGNGFYANDAKNACPNMDSNSEKCCACPHANK